MNFWNDVRKWFAGENSIRAERERFIQTYKFPRGLEERFAQSHPLLSSAQCHEVFVALRTYFWICGRSRGMASMPSQIVDDVWHEFILWTREYSNFCERAFGFFLHHTPAQAMTSPTQAQDGIRRTWRLACLHDGIDPKNPQRLPQLFALDAQLNIPNGFIYKLDCREKRQSGDVYCASHLGCSSCGGSTCTSSTRSAHESDNESNSSDIGGAGGGDSGGDSGCGGGCGGD